MRSATITRNTQETKISLSLGLDGSGQGTIDSGIGFLDHMLTLFKAHGQFDLTLSAQGDLSVDQHHCVEDIGICLGTTFKEALGDGAGIRRFGWGLICMDEALCQMAIDISGRPFLAFDAPFPKAKVGDFDLELIEEFFHGFVSNAKIALHLRLLSGQNLHHMAESCFKALGIVLDQATQLDNRKKGIPSTKGVL